MGLEIIGALWADVAVVSDINKLINQSKQSLTLDMGTIHSSLPNVYYNQKKSLSILLRYTEAAQNVFFFAQMEGSGTFDIQRDPDTGNVTNTTALTSLPTIRGLTQQIYAASYGGWAIDNPDVLGRATNAMNLGQVFYVSNADMSRDPFWDAAKFLHIYYGPIVLEGNTVGDVQAKGVRENSVVTW